MEILTSHWGKYQHTCDHKLTLAWLSPTFTCPLQHDATMTYVYTESKCTVHEQSQPHEAKPLAHTAESARFHHARLRGHRLALSGLLVCEFYQQPFSQISAHVHRVVICPQVRSQPHKAISSHSFCQLSPAYHRYLTAGKDVERPRALTDTTLIKVTSLLGRAPYMSHKGCLDKVLCKFLPGHWSDKENKHVCSKKKKKQHENEMSELCFLTLKE